jgi:SDR family mycofactocin-dependent oxidoreductase
VRQAGGGREERQLGKVNGKVAFVTGAARGQGRSHAVTFAEQGADIIAIDLCEQVATVAYPMSTIEDLNETQRLVEKAGGRIYAQKADVRDADQLASALEVGVAELGRLDFVVANAGILTCIEPQGLQRQAWFDCIDIMLSGAYNAISVSLPHLIEQGEGGSIVITSSTTGLRGVASLGQPIDCPGNIGYHAAKHGVVGLMRIYANMLAPHSIRVNTVHPCGVNSPMLVNDEFTAWATKHNKASSTLQNPLPVALIEPVDVSNTVLFLCSDEGRYITGVTLPVDAGFTNKV